MPSDFHFERHLLIIEPFFESGGDVDSINGKKTPLVWTPACHDLP